MNQQKGISTIIGIIIIIAAAIVLFGGAFAYQYYVKSQTPMTNVQQSPNVQNPSSETPEPVPSAIEGWETYRNDEYGFEFKYPDNWTLTIITPTSLSLEDNNKKYYFDGNLIISPINVFIYKDEAEFINAKSKERGNNYEKEVDVNGLTFTEIENSQALYYQNFWIDLSTKGKTKGFILIENGFRKLKNITNQIVSTFKFINQSNNMAKELSYEEANELALKLAEEEFDKKQFRDLNGVLIKAGFNFTGKKEQNRWVFSYLPPAGASAAVSFNLDGSEPEVEVGWSPY